MIAIGIDLLRVDRVARLRLAAGTAFERRGYTPAEQAACGADAVRWALVLSGKEAVAKVLGAGLGIDEPGRIGYHDVEFREIGRFAPVVSLRSRAAQRAAVLGVAGMVLRWRHVSSWVCSLAVATSDPTERHDVEDALERAMEAIVALSCRSRRRHGI